MNNNFLMFFLLQYLLFVIRFTMSWSYIQSFQQII